MNQIGNQNGGSIGVVNLTTEKSKEFNVEIDSSVADYVADLRDNISHKHITRSTLMYEIIMLTDDDMDIDDTQSKMENRLDAQLETYGVNPTTINTLDIDTRCETTGDDVRVKMYLPQSLVEQMPYFKSDYVQERVEDYIRMYWNDRDERINFKMELIDVLDNNGSFTRLDVSNKTETVIEQYDEIQKMVEDQQEWYNGLNVPELEERIEEETKETVKDRIPVLQHLFNRKFDNLKANLLGDNPTLYKYDKLASNILNVGEEVEYIMDILSVSKPTAERYLEQLDMFWVEDEFKKSFMEDNADDLIESFIGSMYFSDKESKSLNPSKPADQIVYKIIKQEEIETVSIDGEEINIDLNAYGNTKTVKLV